MRAESSIKPASVSVERCGDRADVILCENITKSKRDGETVWRYDEHRVTVPYRDNLEDVVKANRGAWLEKAIAEGSVDPPPSPEERVIALENENRALREQLDTVMEAVDFILMEV